MRNITSRLRFATCAAVVAVFSLSMLTPKPAAAWWAHPGWDVHPGWHYGWRGCCWGPRVAIGIAPPVVAVAPPVVYAPPPVLIGRVWVPAHWRGPEWVRGHWS